MCERACLVAMYMYVVHFVHVILYIVKGLVSASNTHNICCIMVDLGASVWSAGT